MNTRQATDRATQACWDGSVAQPFASCPKAELGAAQEFRRPPPVPSKNRILEDSRTFTGFSLTTRTRNANVSFVRTLAYMLMSYRPTHARPSGSCPASIRPATSSERKSITATYPSGEQAT